MKMNILHVAVHLGGGAGKAIAGIAVQGQQDAGDHHRILLLDAPEKDGWVRYCLERQVPVAQWDGSLAPFSWADVVVVSWWNHPVMARFLANFPPCVGARVLWCHVNGVHYPVLPFRLASAFDRVMFTSPYSLQNPAWSADERQIIRENASLIYGMGQFRPADMPYKRGRRSGETFVVGYVGTLNYGKLHPNFLSYCQAACERVPELHFAMIGDRNPELERSVRAAGLSSRFTFTGFVNDAASRMLEFDVFGYLLNPAHYGTTENVLLEAMACGLPVIALRQNVEQFIVPPDAGFLVDNPQQYAERLACLRHHPQMCAAMGKNARRHVLSTYDARQNAANFHSACMSSCAGEKKKPPIPLGDSPWEWFLACLSGQDRARFSAIAQALSSDTPAGRERAIRLSRDCPPIFREKRKSSLLHFADTYPEDAVLTSISTIMRQE